MTYQFENMNYGQNGNDGRGKPPQWLIALAGILVIIFMIAAPNLNSSDEPPPGVERYRDGDLLCWDKVVCCNPSDESTCEKIPICEMVAE